MRVEIVADSCCDTNSELDRKLKLRKVPLTIYVGDRELKDNAELDTGELLRLIKAEPAAPRTASPSPQDFLEAYEAAEGSVFVVTISSALSSSYNSAVLAKQLLEERVKEKCVHVFDTLSGSVGETLVSLKIFELARENCEELEIAEKVTEYIRGLKTFFLIDSLDNLVKAGRVSRFVGRLGSVLSLKLIMGSSPDGKIRLVEKVRAAKRVFRRLIDQIDEQGEALEQKVLGIAHCNAREKAEAIKKEALKRFGFRDVIIVGMAGISTVYAGEGGIVIAF